MQFAELLYFGSSASLCSCLSSYLHVFSLIGLL